MARIITTFDNPPIPDRRWDWSAVRDGYEPGDLIGRGRTEVEAVADLFDLEGGASATTCTALQACLTAVPETLPPAVQDCAGGPK